MLATLFYFTGDSSDRLVSREERRKGPRRTAKVPLPDNCTARGRAPRTKTTPAGGGSRSGRGVVRPPGSAPEIEEEEEEDDSVEAAESDGDDSVEEVVPTNNLRTCSIADWRKYRNENPYRFDPRTNNDDPRFWTVTQQRQWEQVYMSFSEKKSWVPSKSLNMEWFSLHENEFPYIRQTLEKMNLWKLVCLNVDYYIPELVQQFYCTVFFHGDEERNMTWMSGDVKVSSNLLEFGKALRIKPGGYCVHRDDIFSKEDLAFCFPAQKRCTLDTSTQMYVFYRQLADLFRDTIMSKAGDLSKIRGYMTNLMYYTKPDKQRKIDVMDFIYEEIRLGVSDRRVPAYSAYVHRFIRHALGDTVYKRVANDRPIQRHELHAIPLLDGPLPPGFPPPELHSTHQHVPSVSAPGGSSSTRPPSKKTKKGITKFFTTMFSVCRDARTFSHNAQELAKENRRIQNADRRAAGHTVEDDDSLAPTQFVDVPMPDFSAEEFFYGFAPAHVDEDEDGDDEEPEE